ncbi:MAG: glycosyltransferase family 2 protein [SAR202 cluster bacterium]|nr:glycosyltransferase family 2 protein [SAR202 cluster bacterium]
MPQPFLSVVIPAFNEELRISDTLSQVVEYLTAQDYEWEVVVADDGSQDHTARLIGQVIVEHPNVRVLRLPHRGKGWAVKNGMLAAQGEYRLLCDADLSVPLAQVERLLPPLGPDCDIVLGSREAPGAARIGEPTRRHLMGRVFNFLVSRLTVSGLADTQCGFKCFRGAVAQDLFQRQTMDGFSFDVELLFLARQRGLTFAEVGVDWYYRPQSKVRPVRDSLAMTLDLLKIRWRHRTPA